MGRKNTIEDIWSKVSISSKNECWEWNGSRMWAGYGCVRFEGKLRRAHRVIFKIVNGYYPENVCHKCDNPPCCNPDHLFPGNQKINHQDKVEKNRQYRSFGVLAPSVKLTENEVHEVKKLYTSGKFSQREISKMFGVNQSSISRIISGENWKYLKERSAC